MINNSIKKSIEKADIVSFDVFDTLLVRPYVKPTDLFVHMEKNFKIPGYADERIDAEERVRINHSELEDITFDMIYDEIHANFKKIKQCELDWEKMVLKPNLEVKQLYDYAKELGKKIIIVSDMYLPSEFLAKVLCKNGYEGFDKIYVSGEYGKTKNTGNLFVQVLKDYQIKPEKILHIGDNKNSDFKQPKKIGIKSYLCVSILKQFLRSNPKLLSYNIFAKRNFGCSVLLGIFALKWQEDKLKNKVADYWEQIGFNYGGPVALGYTQFVLNACKKHQLDRLFFVARDGWILKQVFQHYEPSFPIDYVYAPRYLNFIYRLDYNRNNIYDTKSIIYHYLDKDNILKEKFKKLRLENALEYHRFIQENIDIFSNLAKKEFETYKHYLSSKVSPNEKIGIVDTITEAFSSQKLIQSSISNEMVGLYWGIVLNKNIYNFKTDTYVGQIESIEQSNEYYFTKNWIFIESLITSPEAPVHGISNDGFPIYDENINTLELKRQKRYQTISKGVLSFVDYVQNVFDRKDVFLDFASVVQWVNCFIDNPNKEDRKKFTEFYFGLDGGHFNYIPLFSAKIPFFQFVKNFKKNIKFIKSLQWRSFWQSVALCIAKPISVRIKGIKVVRITILPLLQNRYFMVHLSLWSSCQCLFCVGKRD